MYYEEKIINGVLCYRSTPSSEFKPFTVEELSKKVESYKKKYKEVIEFIGYVKSDMIQSKDGKMFIYPLGWEARIDRINQLTQQPKEQ